MQKSDQSTNQTSRVVSNRKFVGLLASVTKPRFEVPFFVGLCALLFMSASPIPGSGRTGRGLQAIPVVALTPARSSEGNFTMALPQGWSLTASPGGDSIQATPVGKRQPSVYVVIVSVSDLRYQARIAACGRGFAPFGNALTQCVIPSVRIQLNDSKRQWSPQEAFQLILQRLQQAGRGAQQFGAPMLTPSSASQAFYRAAGRGRNGPTENWGIITMFYFANPMLGRGEVTSLAMLAGCSASAGQANVFRRTCAGVINSFRPDPNWFGRLAAGIENIYGQEAQILIRMGQNIVQGYQVREQMITSLSQSVRSMQLQSFHTMQSTNYRNQQGWIAAFAGNTLLRDPATGKLLSVPYGYNSYGIDDRGPVPIVIYGNNVKAGTSVGTATVQRMLP